MYSVKVSETAAKDALYHNLTCPYFTISRLNSKEPFGNTESFKYLKNAYLLNFVKNILLKREFMHINRKFRESGIIAAPIKGMALLYDVYDDPGLRQLADIDILVKNEYLKKSEHILMNLGYELALGRFSKRYYCNHHCHLPFRNKYLVELHWNLSVSQPNRIVIPELWQRLRNIESEENIITLLSPEDTILSIALHLRRFNRPFSLKYIVDIYKIIEKYKEKLDWYYILKCARTNRLFSLIYYTLVSVNIALEYPIRSQIIDIFYPGVLRAFLLKSLIKRTKKSGVEKIRKSAFFRKTSYIFLRFLLYDRALDFANFIQTIPIEEFARFYSIEFPSKKAIILYKIRFITIPFKLIFR